MTVFRGDFCRAEAKNVQEVVDERPLVDFLYTLIGKHLPLGVVDQMVADSEVRGDIRGVGFGNTKLAAYCQLLADSLSVKEPTLVKVKDVVAQFKATVYAAIEKRVWENFDYFRKMSGTTPPEYSITIPLEKMVVTDCLYEEKALPCSSELRMLYFYPGYPPGEQLAAQFVPQKPEVQRNPALDVEPDGKIPPLLRRGENGYRSCAVHHLSIRALLDLLAALEYIHAQRG